MNAKDENNKKTWKNGSEKAQLFTALRKQDYTIKEAMTIAGLRPTQAYNIEKKLLANDIPLHNMARKNVKHLAKGEKFGDIQEIRDSTVLAANQVILDRTEPKINKIEQDTRSISIELTADVSDWADSVLKSICLPSTPKVSLEPSINNVSEIEQSNEIKELDSDSLSKSISEVKIDE